MGMLAHNDTTAAIASHEEDYIMTAVLAIMALALVTIFVYRRCQNCADKKAMTVFEEQQQRRSVALSERQSLQSDHHNGGVNYHACQ